jgi:single-strand DNA-binding protein
MFSKVVNVGRDAVLRKAGSTSVINLVGAYTVGYGDNKKTQWIELSCWGKQAESLAQYVVKGAQFCVHADDIHIDTFTKDDGTVIPKLVGRLVALEFCGSAAQNTNAHPSKPPAKEERKQEDADDFNDDIPF